MEETQEMMIIPEKRKQIINTLIKMKYSKINNLLCSPRSKLSKFVTRNWIKVNDQSGYRDNRYDDNKQIRFKTPMLRPDLCDYSPFISCISKINSELIENAEDLDVAM